jgi:hypothetical protein
MTPTNGYDTIGPAVLLKAAAEDRLRGASTANHTLKPPPPSERPMLHQALDAQVQLLEQLHDQLTRLEGRLDCVLVYEDRPGNGSDGATRSADPTRPTDRLQLHALLIEHAAARVSTLLRRLEL